MLLNPGGPANDPLAMEPGRLYRNQGNGYGWMATRLRGVLSNRDAIGARLTAITASGTEVHRQVTAGKGFGNTDSPVQHFGFGNESVIDRVLVQWPSGIRQTLLGPSSGMRHDLTETGLRLIGTPVVGTTITIQFCGRAGDSLEVFAGTSTIEQDMPKYGGVLRVAPPFLGPWSLSLNSSGRLDVGFAIPNQPMLIGTSLVVQSWTHAPGTGSGGVLTNLVVLVFE
jgi:hypothetical protein